MPCNANVTQDEAVRVVRTPVRGRAVWLRRQHADNGVLFSNGHVATAIDDWKSTKYFHTFSAFIKSYVPQHIEWMESEEGKR